MPLLSICIPTCNRAGILDVTLGKLTTEDVFLNTNDVEIVISDNCSEDNTPEVVEKYVSLYGEKIRYFRNTENIYDKNFALVLSYGRGEFLKLCNDTLLFISGALAQMVQIIQRNRTEKPVLFFLNNKAYMDKSCQTIDDFVKSVSFASSWIGGTGFWKEDKKYLPYMKNFADTKLSQTAVLLKMVSDKRCVRVIAQPFCTVICPSIMGNYNLSEVFLKNYLKLYHPYLQSGELSSDVYNKERWLVLEKHVLPRQFNVKYHFSYEKAGFWIYTQSYHHYLKFYLLIFLCFLKKLKYTIKMPIKRLLVKCGLKKNIK